MAFVLTVLSLRALVITLYWLFSFVGSCFVTWIKTYRVWVEQLQLEFVSCLASPGFQPAVWRKNTWWDGQQSTWKAQETFRKSDNIVSQIWVQKCHSGTLNQWKVQKGKSNCTKCLNICHIKKELQIRKEKINIYLMITQLLIPTHAHFHWLKFIKYI